MANSYRTRFAGAPIMGGITPAVKWLLIANTAIFVVCFLSSALYETLVAYFGLTPFLVVHRFAIWQLFTYMFLHDASGFMHILMNMLTLWMFGTPIEGIWGARRFLRYYFACGIGAGITAVVLNYAFGTTTAPTIGASGAIYGLLLAFGFFFPDAKILFFFLFPIPARIYVWIMGGIVFLSTLQSAGGRVSNVAHLGGLLAGFIYLKTGMDRVRLPAFHPMESMTDRYREWKMARAKRKFQVYLRKQGKSNRNDPWVN
jgi:membrane associated rhomboid family serine protease